MVNNNQNGPNDARCVVWAIGVFFFLTIFYMLTNDLYII